MPFRRCLPSLYTGDTMILFFIVYISMMIITTVCYFWIDNLCPITIGSIVSTFIVSSIWFLIWPAIGIIKLTELEFWNIEVIRRKKK